MIKSTHGVRQKLFHLFSERGREFLSNKHCQNDEEIIKLWDRYLIKNNCMPSERSKKGYAKITDPVCQNRSVLIPQDLIEKVLILNYAPPIPPIVTVGDLCIRAIVREYRVKNFNISVYESVTKENLLLFHSQYNFEDYNEKAIKKASFFIPLSSEIINIEKNEVTTNRATLIFQSTF